MQQSRSGEASAVINSLGAGQPCETQLLPRAVPGGSCPGRAVLGFAPATPCQRLATPVPHDPAHRQGCSAPSLPLGRWRGLRALAGLQPGFQQLCRERARSPLRPQPPPRCGGNPCCLEPPWAAGGLGRLVRHGPKGFDPESPSPRGTDVPEQREQPVPCWPGALREGWGLRIASLGPEHPRCWAATKQGTVPVSLLSLPWPGGTAWASHRAHRNRPNHHPRGLAETPCVWGRLGNNYRIHSRKTSGETKFGLIVMDDCFSAGL